MRHVEGWIDTTWHWLRKDTEILVGSLFVVRLKGCWAIWRISGRLDLCVLDEIAMQPEFGTVPTRRSFLVTLFSFTLVSYSFARNWVQTLTLLSLHFSQPVFDFPRDRRWRTGSPCASTSDSDKLTSNCGSLKHWMNALGSDLVSMSLSFCIFSKDCKAK